MWIDARIPVHFLAAVPGEGIPPAALADQALILYGNSSAGEWETLGWATVLQFPEPGPPAQAVPAPPAQAVPAPPARAATGHPSDCSCCRPRAPQATSLTRLFQARARGEVQFFRRVIVHLPAPEAASLRAILVSDPFVSSCFIEAG